MGLGGNPQILKEKFKITKTLRGEYVLATLDLEAQTLAVYYRRSERSQANMMKKIEYRIGEPVVKLKTRYRRGEKKKAEIIEII